MPAPLVIEHFDVIKQLALRLAVAVVPLAYLVLDRGTWLKTRVTARVSQTLRTGRLATAPRRVIEFEHERGELQVNRVIVRSAQGVYFENSKEYLIGVRVHPDSPTAWQVVVMFEIDSLGRLQGAKRRSGSSALHGVGLAEVVAAISKRAQ